LATQGELRPGAYADIDLIRRQCAVNPRPPPKLITVEADPCFLEDAGSAPNLQRTKLELPTWRPLADARHPLFFLRHFGFAVSFALCLGRFFGRAEPARKSELDCSGPTRPCS